MFGQQVELAVGKTRREVLRRGVKSRAAAVDGTAFLGLCLQGGFTLPGLLQLLLPLQAHLAWGGSGETGGVPRPLHLGCQAARFWL